MPKFFRAMPKFFQGTFSDSDPLSPTRGLNKGRGGGPPLAYHMPQELWGTIVPRDRVNATQCHSGSDAGPLAFYIVRPPRAYIPRSRLKPPVEQTRNKEQTGIKRRD